MGSIKVKGRMQRVAIINQNKVVAKPVRYSTVKKDELVAMRPAQVTFRNHSCWPARWPSRRPLPTSCSTATT